MASFRHCASAQRCDNVNIVHRFFHTARVLDADPVNHPVNHPVHRDLDLSTIDRCTLLVH